MRFYRVLSEIARGRLQLFTRAAWRVLWGDDAQALRTLRTLAGPTVATRGSSSLRRRFFRGSTAATQSAHRGIETLADSPRRADDSPP